MNTVKQYLGLLWMAVAVASTVLLIYSAATQINIAKGDVGKPLPWIIIIAVFLPIASGLFLFGWYAWKREYEDKASLETGDR